jgi:hypothetical protein
MSWLAAQPQHANSERERTNFSREIWTRIRFGSVTFAPALVAASTAAIYLIAQSGGDVASSAAVGLRRGMPISVTWPSAPAAGIVVDAWCDLNDTLKVRFQNFSGGGLTPPAGAYSFAGAVI